MSIRNALANTRAATRTIQDTIRNAALEQTSAAISRHLSNTAERAAQYSQQIIFLLEAAQEAEANPGNEADPQNEAHTLERLGTKTAAITGEKGSKKR